MTHLTETSTMDLFQAHRRVAWKIAAKRWNRPGWRHLREEINQAALIGLWRACEGWDGRSIKFASYAQWRINGAITDWWRAEFGSETRNRQQLFEGKMRSLNAVLRDREGGEKEIDHAAPRQPDLVAIQDEIRKPLSRLSYQEWFCWVNYHGYGKTMREIGSLIGVSESRVFAILRNVKQLFEEAV